MNPRVTLDQWRAFIAVVDQGGYAQAAETLHLSQSTVSYAVARLQELLNVQVLAVSGRKAQLTAAGETLLPRARQLVADAVQLEVLAADLAKGWEAELILVADILCPTNLLLQSLQRFHQQCPNTQVQVREEVLSGTAEAILDQHTHLGLHPFVPPACSAEPLMEVEFIPVASPEHPLQHLQRGLTIQDLKHARQIFIRDTGSKGTNKDDGMAHSPQRWTVSSRETALEMVCQGFGFCWAPEPWIKKELHDGRLLELPLNPPDRRRMPLYLIYPPAPQAGPATELLAESIKAVAQMLYGINN